MDRENTQGAMGETGGRSADEPPQAAGQGAGAPEIEDGAAVDEIAACIRSRERSDSDDGGVATRLGGLVELQREVNGSAAKWAQKRKPGAGERTALLVIEAVRTQALLRIAKLSESEEPVSAEELARLALALYRIADADRLRVAREQAVAAAPDRPAEREPLSQAELTVKIRKALTDRFFAGRWGTPARDALSDDPSPADSDAVLPDPPSESSVDSFARGAGDEGDAVEVQDAGEVCDAQDAEDARDPDEAREEGDAGEDDRDTDHARRARDEKRARDARDPPDVHIARHRDRWAWGGEFWPPEIPLDPSQW